MRFGISNQDDFFLRAAPPFVKVNRAVESFVDRLRQVTALATVYHEAIQISLESLNIVRKIEEFHRKLFIFVIVLIIPVEQQTEPYGAASFPVAIQHFHEFRNPLVAQNFHVVLHASGRINRKNDIDNFIS